MKTTLKIFAAIVMIAGFSTILTAQNTIQTTAAAKIVSALTVSNTGGDGLHFGTMTIPTTDATVVVPPSGLRTNTGTITLLAQSPTYHAAAYGVTGDGTATYAITLPTGTITITRTLPSILTMTVGTFLSSKAGNVSALVGGSDSFTVGATLNLVSGQGAGLYSGTYDVSVAYN